MKSPPRNDVHDLPLPDLRLRVERACLLLRDAALRVGHSSERPASAMAEAIGVARRLLPGFTDPPRSLLVRTIRALGPAERRALRDALVAESTARERLARLLGPLSPAQADDALSRVEILEAATIAMSALFCSADAGRRAAQDVGSRADPS